MRLLGRTYAEPGDYLKDVYRQQFGEVVRRFTAALCHALPGITERDVRWRLHFMVGAMAHTMADTERLRFLSDGTCDPSDSAEVMRQLVSFLAAGLRTPAATPLGVGKGRRSKR